MLSPLSSVSQVFAKHFLPVIAEASFFTAAAYAPREDLDNARDAVNTLMGLIQPGTSALERAVLVPHWLTLFFDYGPSFRGRRAS